MTHSKAFSRREILALIGAAVTAIVTGQPVQAKKRRGSRGSGTAPDLTKPDIQPQPSQPQPIRPNKNGYLAPTPCDPRYSNCNTTAVDESFNPGPIIVISSSLLGGGWLVQNRAKVTEFMKEVNQGAKEAAEKDAVKKQQNAKKTVKAMQQTGSKTGSKKTPSPKSKKTQPPIDPVEVELNQMSAEFGMTTMRPVRKATKPQQIVLWEVFRSGPVGPYTKEQLRSEQKITVKTNVRRVGENEWTRAGEIPELAKFLTTK